MSRQELETLCVSGYKPKFTKKREHKRESSANVELTKILRNKQKVAENQDPLVKSLTHSLTHPLTNSWRRHTWLRLQQQPQQTRRLEAIPWDALATERSIRRNCAVTVTTMISQLDHPKKSLIFLWNWTYSSLRVSHDLFHSTDGQRLGRNNFHFRWKRLVSFEDVICLSKT